MTNSFFKTFVTIDITLMTLTCFNLFTTGSCRVMFARRNRLLASSTSIDRQWQCFGGVVAALPHHIDSRLLRHLTRTCWVAPLRFRALDLIVYGVIMPMCYRWVVFNKSKPLCCVLNHYCKYIEQSSGNGEKMLNYFNPMLSSKHCAIVRSGHLTLWKVW